jgi:hypothetical protein
MNSTHCDKNASEPTDATDDQLDNQTREFIDALDHSSFDVDNIEVSTENALHIVEATLQNVGQRNGLKQYARRYDFGEADFVPQRSQDGDSARVKLCRYLDEDATTSDRRDNSTNPRPILPDSWSWTNRRGEGNDVFEHDEADLSVTISKRSGRTARHDDFTWVGTIRRGESPGEPLTWGGSMSLDAMYAATAKFAAGASNGDYHPSDHAPDDPWEWDRPRWPDVLGYDDASADPREWTQTTDGDA